MNSSKENRGQVKKKTIALALRYDAVRIARDCLLKYRTHYSTHPQQLLSTYNYKIGTLIGAVSIDLAMKNHRYLLIGNPRFCLVSKYAYLILCTCCV